MLAEAAIEEVGKRDEGIEGRIVGLFRGEGYEYWKR